MRAEFPDKVDDFRLPMSRDEYNEGVTDDRPLSPLRFAYILDGLERKAFEADDHFADVEGLLDSITAGLGDVEKTVKELEENAVLSAGYGLTKNGTEMALANPIGGDVNVTGSVASQQGHGQFVDSPSFVAGFANLRNGIIRLYCIDTGGYIEIESPDAILSPRKQYLQDKDGKIALDESGFIEVSNGFKVNGLQIIGTRKTGWTEPTGSPDKTQGFDTENPDVKALARFLYALYVDLVSHGIIGE